MLLRAAGPKARFGRSSVALRLSSSPLTCNIETWNNNQASIVGDLEDLQNNVDSSIACFQPRFMKFCIYQSAKSQCSAMTSSRSSSSSLKMILTSCRLWLVKHSLLSVMSAKLMLLEPCTTPALCWTCMIIETIELPLWTRLFTLWCRTTCSELMNFFNYRLPFKSD
jgi:hypothetical protein